MFIYFTDHGATGLIAFPEEYLFMEDLMDILSEMQQARKYGQLVFYLETCFSGSMFEKLSRDLNVYAVSAANAQEESWACYCYPGDEVGGVNIGSCLGDVFSLQFVTNSLSFNNHNQTLLN